MDLATRAIIALTLVFAPWAFGATERWSIRTLEVLCVASAIFLLFRRTAGQSFGLRHGGVVILGLLVFILIGTQLLNPVQIKIVARRSVYELIGGSLSLPYTIHWWATMETGLRWAALLLFGFALLHSVQTRDDVSFILRLLVLNAVLISIEGILQRLSGVDRLLGFRTPRYGGAIFGPFVCCNNFASYANLCLPVAMGMALLPDILPRRSNPAESTMPERFFWGFCAAILFAAVVLSASRAGVAVSLLITGAAVLDFAFRRRGSSKRLGGGHLTILLLLGAGVILLVGGATHVLWRFEHTELAEPARMEAWRAIWAAITQSPWWGYGLGTFRYLCPFYQAEDNFLFYDYAHQDWLEALFDFGAVGFGLLTLFVGSVLFHLAKERILKTSTFRRSVAGCVLIALLGCLAHALVDFPLHIAAIQITFVTIAAVGLSLRFVSER